MWIRGKDYKLKIVGIFSLWENKWIVKKNTWNIIEGWRVTRSTEGNQLGKITKLYQSIAYWENNNNLTSTTLIEI